MSRWKALSRPRGRYGDSWPTHRQKAKARARARRRRLLEEAEA